MSNPWGLTEAEARTLDAIIETGSLKGASSLLNLSHKTIENLAHRAKERMGLLYGGQVRHLILWDRFRNQFRNQFRSSDG